MICFQSRCFSLFDAEKLSKFTSMLHSLCRCHFTFDFIWIHPKPPLRRLCETLWSWSANATVFLDPAPFGPVGEAYRTWKTSQWIWRPSTCQPLRWSIGPWAHASNSSPKTSTSGQSERTSWFICRVHQTFAWGMTRWALLVLRTGETN